MADNIPEQPTNDRTSIRTAIFAGKAKVLLVTAFGVDLELRQPSMGELLDLQDLPDQKSRVVASLIRYCFVPGTKEKVFDEADRDSILALPFDENFVKINDAIAELTGIDLEEEKGNSEDDPISITS